MGVKKVLGKITLDIPFMAVMCICASNGIKFDWKLQIQMNLLENYAFKPSKSTNLPSAHHCFIGYNTTNSVYSCWIQFQGVYVKPFVAQIQSFLKSHDSDQLFIIYILLIKFLAGKFA